MAVRDDVRQLATKKAQAFTPDPNLTPVAPTATIGNRDPSSRKPNKGFKRFMVGPGGDYSDLADPGFYARGLADEANKQVVQPLAQLPSAFDPTADLSMAERINRAGTGALVAADLVTPFLPEGTIANSLRREAMEKALDREVAGYAASGGGAKYRGVLGVHGSPVSGLTEIQARTGSQLLPDTPAAFNFRANQPTFPFDYERMVVGAENYGRRKMDDFGSQGSIYVTRTPQQGLIEGVPEDFVVSSTGSQVVGEVPIIVRQHERDKVAALRKAMFDVMTPAEKRAARAAALQRQLARGKKYRDIYNLRTEPGDF